MCCKHPTAWITTNNEYLQVVFMPVASAWRAKSVLIFPALTATPIRLPNAFINIDFSQIFRHTLLQPKIHYPSRASEPTQTTIPGFQGSSSICTPTRPDSPRLLCAWTSALSAQHPYCTNPCRTQAGVSSVSANSISPVLRQQCLDMRGLDKILIACQCAVSTFKSTRGDERAQGDQ